MPAKQAPAKRDIVKAVVILDPYEKEYSPLVQDLPMGLWPINCVPALLFTLDVISSSDIDHVIIVLSSHMNLLQHHVSKSIYSKSMAIEWVFAPTACSVGDALRELESKHLITSNFVLIDRVLISNVSFADVIGDFNKILKQDKNAVAEIMVNNMKNERIGRSDLVVSLSEKNKILFYKEFGNENKTAFPETTLHDCTNRYDLSNSRVTVCTPHFLSLFADNFDYMNMADAIKGTIEDESISGHTIYAFICEKRNHYPLNNLNSYRKINFHVAERKLYPYVPEYFENFSYSGLNKMCSFLYVHENNSKLFSQQDIGSCTVVGKQVTVSPTAVISDSVIGNYSFIDDEAYISSSVIWNNVTVGKRCCISCSIIANDVTIQSDVDIADFCVICCGVILPKNSKVARWSIVLRDDNEISGISVHELNISPDIWTARSSLWGDTCILDEEDTEEDETSQMGTENEITDTEYDDRKLVQSEIYKTINRAIHEELSIENLILEVNGLKHAYNVSIRELIEIITESFLKLPLENDDDYFVAFKKLVPNIKDFVQKYIKNEDTQVHFIYSLELTAMKVHDVEKNLLAIMNFLYMNDVLEEPAILRYYKSPLLQCTECLDELKILNIRNMVKPFLDWLNSAEEESD